MTALSLQAALVIALKCVPPAVAPVMVAIAQHESGLDPAVVHHNAKGTDDVGIAQVNTSNFAWTGLTWQTALDPCANFRTGAMVLFAKYNGNPPAMVKTAYADAVLQPASDTAHTGHAHLTGPRCDSRQARIAAGAGNPPPQLKGNHLWAACLAVVRLPLSDLLTEDGTEPGGTR
jgi:hypothetical protein